MLMIRKMKMIDYHEADRLDWKSKDIFLKKNWSNSINNRGSCLAAAEIKSSSREGILFFYLSNILMSLRYV